MAATKLMNKLVRSMIKKKKKGKSYSDQVKPKPKTKLDKAVEFAKKTGFLGRHNEPRLKQIISKNKLVGILNDPAERKKITAAVGKKATQEKAPTKKTKAEVKVPKKSDKRIEGSGSQSARPKGSIGKSRGQDRPTGSVAGLSMSDARKAQARKNQPGNIKNKTVAMARRYDDLMVGVKRAAVAALRAGDRDKARKILSGTGISVSDFISVIRQRGKM